MNWLKNLLSDNKKKDPIWVLTSELLTYRDDFQKLDVKAQKLRLTSDLREDQLNIAKQYLKSLMDDLSFVVLSITQSGGGPLFLGRISYRLRQVVENHSHSSNIRGLQDVGLVTTHTMNMLLQSLRDVALNFEQLENVQYPVDPDVCSLLNEQLNKQQSLRGRK